MLSLSAPLIGALSDRFGPRKVILASTIIFALLLLFAPLLPAQLAILYVFYSAAGLAGNGTAPIPYGRLVASWFDRRRGLALGLALVGIGLGAIFMPALSQKLIARVGWRNTYTVIAALILAIPVPAVALFMKDVPAMLGQFPDGAPSRRSAAPIGAGHAIEGFTWPEARRTSTFWRIVAAIFLLGGSVHGCVLHLAPLLTDKSVPADTVALAVGTFGAALMIGRAGSGYLLDRFFAPRVGMSLFAAAACGMALLRFAADTPLVFPAVFLVGMGMGAEVDMIAYLTSRYFGLRALGEIYGYAFAGFTLAGALGPWLMGLGFDRTGSYHSVLLAFCAATLLSAALVSTLGPYRFRPA